MPMQPRPAAEISSFECPIRTLRIAPSQCAYVKIKRQPSSITSARLTAGNMNQGTFNQLKHGTLPRAWWEDRYDDPNTTFRYITCGRAGSFAANGGRGTATAG